MRPEGFSEPIPRKGTETMSRTLEYWGTFFRTYSPQGDGNGKIVPIEAQEMRWAFFRTYSPQGDGNAPSRKLFSV